MASKPMRFREGGEMNTGLCVKRIAIFVVVLLFSLFTSIPKAQNVGPGPLLKPAEFFTLVDLDYPGLEAVKVAVNSGDIPGAIAAMATYYRARTSVPWTFDHHDKTTNVSYNKTMAQDALTGTVSVVKIPYTFPNGEIDWFYNHTVASPELADSKEWQWQLNRMYFWPQMAKAYWATGDEEYAIAWVKQFRSWVAQCPKPTDAARGEGSAWRTIECGNRMSDHWAETWHRFLSSPNFTDTDIIYFVSSYIEQARHIREHFSTTGNWLANEMDGLYSAGGLFPEIKEAQEWRNLAAQTMGEQLDIQILPDGAQIEMTTGYHLATLNHTVSIYTMAQMFGRTAEMPLNYLSGLERGYSYAVHLMNPEWNLPRFNDTGGASVSSSLSNVYGLFPHRSDFAWVGTKGKEGSPPDRLSVGAPYAGTFAMRTGWETNSNYLAFDAGLPGFGHIHLDKLNLVMWSHGREVLYDGGGGAYDASKWRTYGTSTYSHNTVIVDGLDQKTFVRDRWDNVPSEPVPVSWQVKDGYDFIAAEYDGEYGSEDNKPARHKRQVLFIKPDIVIVADHMIPNDEASHNYEARWHLNSVTTDHNTELGQISTTDEGEPNLSIAPLFPSKVAVTSVSGQESPDIRGFNVTKTGPIPSTTVGHRVEGSGTQYMASVFQLLDEGESPSITSVTESGLNSEVLFGDGTKLVVTLKSDTGSGIVAQSYLASGAVGQSINIDNVSIEKQVFPRSDIIIQLQKNARGRSLFVVNVAKESRYNVFDLKGRLLLSGVHAKGNTLEVVLDRRTFVSGHYLIRIEPQKGGRAVSFKFSL